MGAVSIEAARRLVRRFKTRNPFEIAEALNIEVMFDNSFSRLKGFYTIMNRQPYIVINGRLSEEKLRIVAAHELGHDRLHKHLARQGAMREFELYDMTARPEYEANSFAAELLIPDEEIKELISAGYDMEQISVMLSTDINLVGIKLGNMNSRGENYRIGIPPRGDFLGK